MRLLCVVCIHSVTYTPPILCHNMKQQGAMNYYYGGSYYTDDAKNYDDNKWVVRACVLKKKKLFFWSLVVGLICIHSFLRSHAG